MSIGKILVTTHPFGTHGYPAKQVLEEAGYEIVENPFHRRLTSQEVAERIVDVVGYLASTEPVTRDVLEAAKNLKALVRVGVGTDSIDLKAVRAKGIPIAYTPKAPVQGAAELTLALMMNLFRHVGSADRVLRGGKWDRKIGRLLSESTVGIIGVGRIGSRVANLLTSMGCNVLLYDIAPQKDTVTNTKARWVVRETLLAQSDVVSLHVQLTPDTFRLCNQDFFLAMKPGAFLLNTSRGPVVDERALVENLRSKHLGGAGLDVYDQEPYVGPLVDFPNVVLTAHMGAATRETRAQMEQEAVEDLLRLLSGKPAKNPIPEDTLDAAELLRKAQERG